MKLKGKVAIVTGGSRGMGKAVSLVFAYEGATVVLATRNLSKLKETADEITSKGGRIKAIRTDVCDEKEVQRMLA